MKKFAYIALFLFLLFGVFSFAFAQEKKVEINFFYSPTCSHCAQEWKFLETLKDKYPEIEIKKLPISKKENVELLKSLYQDYEIPSEFQGLVPATFIKNQYFIGFDENIGKNIENCVLQLGKPGDFCETEEVLRERIGFVSTKVNLEEKINLPIVGEIDIRKYSLPALTVVLGILDGFNVCSLGALILILGLVLAFRSRTKILIFGGIFILVTAIVYGILIVLWYQIFSFFVLYLRIMEYLIGFLGIGGGIYFLREFIRFRKTGPVCKTGGENQIVSRFSLRIQKTFKESRNILVILGSIILFAGIITILEFPCSAAVPVVYAGILAQNNFSPSQYLLYISFYLFFYMFDEIIVFLIAFFTMAIWLTSSKIITWVSLVEAIILFILGFYYLFGFGAFL